MRWDERFVVFCTWIFICGVPALMGWAAFGNNIVSFFEKEFSMGPQGEISRMNLIAALVVTLLVALAYYMLRPAKPMSTIPQPDPFVVE